MWERIANGWEMAKQSVQVLRLDKELLLFPLLSGIACTLVTLSFGIPLLMSGMLDHVRQHQTTAQTIIWAVIGFAFYFVNYFVMIFFNSALIGCAVIRLKGGDPTVRDGIGAAMARLPQIAGWALVSATVGLILKVIESRSNRFGQFVADLIGMAWSLVTYFVVPVLVIEKAGPVTAFKRSTEIFAKTWGESLSASFGIGLFVTIAIFLASVPIGLGGVALANQLPVVGVVAIAFGCLLLLVVLLVSSALHSIIRAALYIYAAEGQTPQLFDASMLQHAFAPKNR